MSSLDIEIVKGDDIQLYIKEISEFRIRYFRDFPYLYVGNFDYESKYLQGYSDDQCSLLATIRNKKKQLVAISTGLPLSSPSPILENALQLFNKAGISPSKIYYYGEVIIDYPHRGKGLLKEIFRFQDNHVKALGFTRSAIATVIRDDKDNRAPGGYLNPDIIWQNLGYRKTAIVFEYNWPTLQFDGTTQDSANQMIYWVKDL